MRRTLGVVLAAVLLALPAAAQNPNSGTPMKLAGLHAAARISRDVHGIAHVQATNAHDVFFLQGWVHAEDRLFQMDASRRQADGTLAELLGPGALSSDVQFRTLGLRRAAEASWDAISRDARIDLEAYAAGVNAWVERHPLPPEYAALELTQFRPWTAIDSLTVAKLIAFGLSFDLEDIENTVALQTYVGAGQALGFDGRSLFFDDLWRVQPFSSASTVPDATMSWAGGGATPEAALGSPAAPRPAASGLPTPEAVDLAKRWLDEIRAVPALRDALDRDRRPGSNEWAVSGEHTVDGRPLVANDPHLALDVPSTFYPIHLRTGSMNVYGNGFAGAPFVITGHNDAIAWGATVDPLDVTDVFQEQVVPDPDSPSGLATLYQGQPEPILAVPETFRVNSIGDHVPDSISIVPPEAGVPAATLIVPRRNHGPIVQLDPASGAALSVQFTGFGPTREVDTFRIWDEAEGLDDFLRGLQYFDFGSQNFAYADVRGNIAYFASSEMPVREDLQQMTVNGLPPWFIRNGQGGNEWLPVQNPQPGQAVPYEILPFDEMPHLVNPPAGFFVNANNDPAGTNLDNDPLNQLRPGGGIYYLNAGYDGYRAGRITELLRSKLAGGAKVSFGDMQAVQADVGLIDAEYFVPWIVRALDDAGADGADPALAAFADDPGVVEAVGRLAGWNFTTPTGILEGYDASDVDGALSEPTADEAAASVAATIYSAWRGQFIRNVLDDTLLAYPVELPLPRGAATLPALRHLLDTFDATGGVGASGIDFFANPAVPDPAARRDVAILESLRNALDRLAGAPFEAAFGLSTDQSDYRWGRLHRIVLDHPLGPPFSIPPAGGAFPAPLEGLRGIPTDGGFGTPDAAAHNPRAQSVDDFMFGSGPANRFVAVADPARGVHAESIWPGGTSGVLGSPHYVDLLPLWLTNDTIPLLQQDGSLPGELESVTKFVPDKSAPRGRSADAPNGAAKSSARRDDAR